MKIKYITNVRIPTPRAQGYAVMKVCEEFAKQGVELQLVVPNKRNNESEKNPFKYYGVSEIFLIKKVNSIDLLGPYEAFGKLFYWIDALSFLLFLRFSKELNTNDIIYTRDYIILSVIPKSKNICLELHSISSSKFLFKLLIKKVKTFFVLNKYIKDELVNMGVPESKIHISPSGVDTNEFSINETKEESRAKLSLPNEKKIVLYTGHLYKWKGVYTLAETAKKLPEYLFLFIGGVDPELSEFKDKFSKTTNIICLPFVERKIIPTYLNSADVLVIPNSSDTAISSRYTSPLKLFEYMTSGVPIVASDLFSIREVLNDKNCFFAEPDNPESFQQQIEKVLSDYDFSLKLANQARSDVEKYTWSNRAKDILSIIKINE